LLCSFRKCITWLHSPPEAGVLTSLTYNVLLALADRDRHGYGIIKELEQRLGADAAPSTGALYLALQRMEGEGLVTEAPARARTDARRRYYRLTRAGRVAALAESRRLAALVELAREKKLLTEGGRA
jgi:DNA-binding PadR family transcriptional regulator